MCEILQFTNYKGPKLFFLLKNYWLVLLMHSTIIMENAILEKKEKTMLFLLYIVVFSHANSFKIWLLKALQNFQDLDISEGFV